MRNACRVIDRAVGACRQEELKWMKKSRKLLTLPSKCNSVPGRHMFVGISERTNEAGAAALAKAFGASLPVIPVPVVSDGTSRFMDTRFQSVLLG